MFDLSPDDKKDAVEQYRGSPFPFTAGPNFILCVRCIHVPDGKAVITSNSPPIWQLNGTTGAIDLGYRFNHVWSIPVHAEYKRGLEFIPSTWV